MARQWVIVRIDGDGATRYETERADDQVSNKVSKSALPDFEKAMMQRFTFGIEQLGWTVTGENFDAEDDDDDDPPWRGDEDEDIDLDDIKKMSRKELIAVIEEYELDIEEPEDIKPKLLKRLVRKAFEKLQE